MKKDLSTKIISLLFAIFMWFYIIQVQNPEIEKTIKDVPVQFTKSELESRGLTLINDKEVQINVKIKGQRKYITNVKKEDITVVADVSSIDSTGTHKISTNVILPYGNLEVMEQDPSYLTVNVDEIVSVDKEITVNVTGEPDKDYCVSDIKVTPEKITLTGPKSIVNTIDKVTADVDVEGKSEDVKTADNPISLIGTSGEAFNTPYVTLDDETVDIHCVISKKKSVNIDIKFADGINNDKEYYVLDESSVKTIEIAGTADAIEKVNKISTESITREMITESGEVEVGLQLPSGIKSLQGEKVTIRLKKVSTAG